MRLNNHNTEVTMKYIMRKIKFERNGEVCIPAYSLNVQIVRDPLWDEWVVMFLEPVE